eukprot:6138167-Pyramimonas_sp.AAC.1
MPPSPERHQLSTRRAHISMGLASSDGRRPTQVASSSQGIAPSTGHVSNGRTRRATSALKGVHGGILTHPRYEWVFWGVECILAVIGTGGPV